MNQKTLSIIVKAQDQASKVFGRIGNSITSVGKKAIATAKLAGLTIAGLVAGFVIKGGISRALNIEDAQAKLKGLGHSTKEVQGIMDSALKSVKGTAFGLDSAATAAASAVAAGVKPGKDLTRVLSLTGDAATIMGRSFGESGAIINKVLASNRVSMEEVNQLQDAGLPILSMLGKEYGVSAAKMREMVSSGEVDSKRFLKALQTNIGGAALASGKTTRGAWDNMLAAMSRVGAAIVKDVIPKVRDAFGSIGKWFDANQGNIINAIGTTVETVKSLAGQIAELASQVWENLGPKFTALWNTLNQDIVPILKDLWNNVLVPLIPVIGVSLVAAIGLALDAFNFILSAIGWVWQALKNGNPIIWGLVGLFGSLAAVMAFNAVFNALTIGFNVLTLITIPRAMTSIRLLKVAIASPTVFGAIAIGAAIVALVAVRNAANEARRAIDGASNAARSAADSNASVITTLNNLAKNGSPAQRARAKSTLQGLANDNSFATGTQYAPGGLTWVGEHGKELVDLPRGSKVIPNKQTDEHATGSTFNMYGSINLGSSNAVDRFFERLDSQKEMGSLGVGV